MMSGECTESTRADQEIGVVVSFDRSSYTAFVPALDITMSAGSLVGLRSLVAEAVMRVLASESSDCVALEWRYEPFAGRESGRAVELPAQRDSSDADTPSLSPRPTRYTQAMADRKFSELRRRGRTTTQSPRP